MWVAESDKGVTTFRVAEDGTFADVHDAAFVLGESDEVTVAHPITMSEEDRTAWRTRFADYRLVQPFPQLGRELFSVSASEIGEHAIDRAIGIQTSRGRLFQLGRRGWRARFGSESTEYEKQLPCGAAARFEVTPPVVQGGQQDQVFTVATATCTYALDRLPPTDYSELMRDLEYARS